MGVGAVRGVCAMPAVHAMRAHALTRTQKKGPL